MNLKEPLTLSKEFHDIMSEMEGAGQSLLITGKAGTGKSTLLQVFRNTTKKKVAVLAPTGIAALNVRGQTIHSFFGFPPNMINPSNIRKTAQHRLYKNLDAIIIDEISMVRADIMDNINVFLKKNRGNNKPFGGVQMFFFGDLFQLPPVVATDFEKHFFENHYASPYFFSAKVLQSEVTYPMVELTKVFRQSDNRFIEILNRIRLNETDYDDLEALNRRCLNIQKFHDSYITLCTRNYTAQALNRKALQEIKTNVFHYKAHISGTFQSNLFPTEEMLALKVGAQVMFIKNDPEKRFVNGTIGKISRLEKESVYVTIKNDGLDQHLEIEVEKLEWEIIRYTRTDEQNGMINTEVIGSFVQYPLKLAWAITIHKSQGKTFDQVIIDLEGGAFEYGQSYVALSRCKSLEGIILKKPLKKSDILIDERVCGFYRSKQYYL